VTRVRIGVRAVNTIGEIKVAGTDVAGLVAESVADPGVAAARSTLGHVPGHHQPLGPTHRDEVFGQHLRAEKDIVVEVDELLRQAGNTVQVGFDGRRAEHGQVRFVGENVFVRHYC